MGSIFIIRLRYFGGQVLSIPVETALVPYDPILCDFELPLTGTFYPLGFTLQISTNSHHVLDAAQRSWGAWKRTFPDPPVILHVGVTEESNQRELVPPICRGRGNLVSQVSDPGNFAVTDLSRAFSFCWVTQSTAQDHALFRYHFLDGLTLIMLVYRSLTAVHAACVSWDGHGMLLCGESGAGKSSLAFACARRGWTFTCDDASELVRGRHDRVVIGNPYSMRFRENALELFLELQHERVIRRVTGDLAVELATPDFPQIKVSPEASIDYIIFLNRQASGGTSLHPFSRESALRIFEQTICYGEPPVRDAQRAALRRLLTADLYELTYSDLDATVARLQALASTGR